MSVRTCITRMRFGKVGKNLSSGPKKNGSEGDKQASGKGRVCDECLFLGHRGPAPCGAKQRAPKGLEKNFAQCEKVEVHRNLKKNCLKLMRFWMITLRIWEKGG